MSEIEDLKYQIQILKEKLESEENERVRLTKMDFDANARVAKYAEKWAMTKKSLMGEIVKLRSDLEDALALLAIHKIEH